MHSRLAYRRAAVALLLAGCVRTGPPPRQQPSAPTVQRFDSLLGAQSWPGNVVPAFDDDVVYLHPGAEVIRGFAAASRLLRRFASGDARLGWRPEHTVVAADSSLAMSWGSTTIAGAAAHGRYLAVWRPDSGGWRIVALVYAGLVAAAPDDWRSPAFDTVVTAPALPFAAADRDFAAQAGSVGAADAFHRFAHRDGVTFGRGDVVNRGPDAIRAALAGSTAHWNWWPVAGGASRDGSLGWTVGRAVIAPRDGAPVYSKYLTVWMQTPDGPRFIADAGNARPAPAEGAGRR